MVMRFEDGLDPLKLDLVRDYFLAFHTNPALLTGKLLDLNMPELVVNVIMESLIQLPHPPLQII